MPMGFKATKFYMDYNGEGTDTRGAIEQSEGKKLGLHVHAAGHTKIHEHYHKQFYYAAPFPLGKLKILITTSWAHASQH